MMDPLVSLVVFGTDEPGGSRFRALDVAEVIALGGPPTGAARNAALDAATGTHVGLVGDPSVGIGEVEALIAAIPRDPGAVWTLPAEQVHPRGRLAAPPPGTWPWGLSGRACVIPRTVVEAGVRFAELDAADPMPELGSRLHWLGARIRTPDDMPEPTGTSDAHGALFAAMVHVRLYQPSRVNRVWSFPLVLRSTPRMRRAVKARTAEVIGVRPETRFVPERSTGPWPFGRFDDVPAAFPGPTGFVVLPRPDPVSLHRAARQQLLLRRRRLATALKALNFLVFHTVLPPEAAIGPGLRLGHHGLGVVVHPRAVIGAGVTLLHNVTLAADLPADSPERIEVGDGATLGAGAVVVGPRRVAERAVVGAGAVVTKDVPADAVVAGNPAKILRSSRPAAAGDAS